MSETDFLHENKHSLSKDHIYTFSRGHHDFGDDCVGHGPINDGKHWSIINSENDLVSFAL